MLECVYDLAALALLAHTTTRGQPTASTVWPVQDKAVLRKPEVWDDSRARVVFLSFRRVNSTLFGSGDGGRCLDFGTLIFLALFLLIVPVFRPLDARK